MKLATAWKPSPRIITKQRLVSAVFISLTSFLLQQGGARTQAPIEIRMPRQLVTALQNNQPIKARVRAEIQVRRDGSARGSLSVTTPDEDLVFRAIRGRGIFTAGRLVAVELKLRQRGGNLTTATVIPDDPDCLIWDLVGTTVHSFEASGEIRVRGGG